MVHTVGEEELAAETPTDMELDQDRQVSLGREGDMSTVSGLANVGQSLVILSGNVLRSLIGGPITGQQLERVQDHLTRVLQQDVQIDGVERVVVSEVNQSENTVVVDVFVGMNNEFTLPIEL